MFFAMYFAIKTMDFHQKMWFNIINRVNTAATSGHRAPAPTEESNAAEYRWNILKEESLNEEAV